MAFKDRQVRKDNQTVAAKLPAALVVDLDRIARNRGVTRSFLVRKLVEAAADHRVIFKPPPSRRMTVAELGASDVGRAARLQAQDDAATACRDVAAAPGVSKVAPDGDAVARELAAYFAGGQ